MKTYSEIRPWLKTFDIIRCEPSAGKTIIGKWFWKDVVGHIAGIYREPDIDNIRVFESSQRCFTGKKGVHFDDASDWFDKYRGKKFVRHLKLSEEFDNYHSEKVLHRADKFIKLTRGMAYPDIGRRSGRWKLILSKLDLYTPGGKDLLEYQGDDVGVFCSQLWAAMYIYCGLTKITMIGEERELLILTESLERCLEIAQEFTPADFKEGGKFEKILRDGVSLSKEIEENDG